MVNQQSATRFVAIVFSQATGDAWAHESFTDGEAAKQWAADECERLAEPNGWSPALDAEVFEVTQ